MPHVDGRYRLVAALAAGFALWAPPIAAAEDGPPVKNGWYIDRNACPGEMSCTGDWLVLRDTALYDRQFGDRVVGIARVDDKVTTETGFVYTMPMRLTVIHPVDLSVYDSAVGRQTTISLDLGMTLFLLTNEGEGYRKAWVDGRLISVEAGRFEGNDLVQEGYVHRRCDAPSADCWWRIEGVTTTIHSEWWVEMRLPDGTVGWTAETERFATPDF